MYISQIFLKTRTNNSDCANGTSCTTGPEKIELFIPIEERLNIWDPAKRSLNISNICALQLLFRRVHIIILSYNIGADKKFIVLYGIIVNRRRLNGFLNIVPIIRRTALLSRSRPLMPVKFVCIYLFCSFKCDAMSLFLFLWS